MRRLILLSAAALISAAVLTFEIAMTTGPGEAYAPPDFDFITEITGLTRPTAVEVAPNGHVFVIEKDGTLKAYDSLDDTSSTTIVDWRSRTMSIGDLGMLGLAVDPLYANGRNYVYVHYTLDEIPGENNPPHWGDSCSLPEGCIVTSTISRIEVDPATTSFVNSIDLITSATCLQYVGHSNDDLAIGPDGYLYASTGDGADFVVADYGQGGNPCADPPFPSEPTPANGQGGAFRAQDVLTSVGGESNDPVSYNGALLRIHPDTGAAAPGNPLAGGTVAGDDRIVAHGLRNPYRFDFRPGTEELYIGDVGWLGAEELNVVDDVNDGVVENFGWPCYEGEVEQAIYSEYGFCQTLINNPGSFDLTTTLTSPFWFYPHPSTVGDCPGPSSALAGVAFANPNGPYPDEYDKALFLTDYSRQCLWAMLPDGGGVPDPNQIDLVATGIIAVDLEVSPDGDLLTVEPGDFQAGSGVIRRLLFTGANLSPTAVISANTLSGTENVTVFEFDGSASSDPEGQALTYQWDLDGNGSFEATGPTATMVYTQPGSYEVKLRVTDTGDASGETTVTVNVSNTPPVPSIDSPGGTLIWRVGDEITFSGSATDAEDGELSPDTPGQEWEWLLILHHCPGQDCHQHVEGTWSGVSGATFTAPDHEYPSWLELKLVVEDSTGSSASTGVVLQPATSVITLDTEPGGLLVAGGVSAAAAPSPVAIEAIEKGAVSVVAPSPQSIGSTSYAFDNWSDGGERSHDVTVPATDVTITASFNPVSTGFSAGWTPESPSNGWSYWWNETSALGDASGYSPLQWNGSLYDADGVPGNPASGQFPFGAVASGSVHPGLGSSQGASTERYAIIRYEVPEAGSYSIVSSAIADHDCVSSGVELQVLVNDVMQSSQIHSGTGTSNFDQSLGVLAVGDTIDVALGPDGIDVCDSTNLDFFIDRVEAPTGSVIATFSDDFTGGNPSNGWSYLWNESSNPGDPAGYAPLVWNGVFYDSDGLLPGPAADEFAYGYVAQWGVHPGRGSSQAGADRYGIIRYTVTSSGTYDIVNSSVVERGCVSDEVEIQVRAADTLISSTMFTNPIEGDFDTGLGQLTAGQTIEVFVGPAGHDHCDSVNLDFSLSHEPSDVGVTVATFSSDYTGGSPASGWSYLWNENGPIGTSSGYTPLVWNTVQYDSDGLLGGGSGDEFAYGLVADWGVHPGLGTEQETVAADRFAIVRHTVSSAGRYSITSSSIANRGCMSGGVELQVRANNGLVTTMNHVGAAPAAFDVSVGNLAAGDTIDVAVGPDGVNVCDAVDLDFSVSREQTTATTVTVGTFSEHRGSDAGSSGWTYWWNETGAIGNTGGYAQLQWNGVVWDGDGIPGYPSANEFAYGRVAGWGVHPGRGDAQGAADSRWVIIRYTASESGDFDITNSVIGDFGCASSGGVDIQIRTNNALRFSATQFGPTPGSFDQNLGTLAAGDTIEVAVGPGSFDWCDATDIDFTLTRTT